MSRPSPDSWRTISELLDEALELTPDRRVAWLDTLRQRNPGAAATVAAWLEEFDLMSQAGFLDTERVPDTTRTALVGLEVGAYRLVSLIGHGGMGTVWLAERRDGQFDQRVAVKLLNAALINASGTERFSREATILARLTHPQIAHLIDAGISPVGAPFLVLEYVQGEHIDRYCDLARLNVADRLRLFLDVLAPVAHAHANLIVHRDLKPANVLVTGERHVKLLDFGIAKLLDTNADRLTMPGTRDAALTPAYAAPEQLTGGAVTTATDVYALGIVLYQLLTGHHPAAEEGTSPGDLLQAVIGRDPLRPSVIVTRGVSSGDGFADTIAQARGTTVARLSQALAGDLDTIVMTALKKKPAERYATVAALADDIRRVLRNEPIAARPDSVTYRMSKFVRRHRSAVSLAAVAVIALVGGLVGTVTQARRATAQAIRADLQAAEAEAQRDFAQRQLARAEAINDLNAFLIADAAPLGSTFTARDLLARAEHIVRRQENDTEGTRVESLLAVGRVYATVADIAKAVPLLEEAHTLAAAALDPTLQARTSCELARAVVKSGDFARSRDLVSAGLNVLPAGQQFELARVLCYLTSADVERWAGEGEPSVALVLKVRQMAADANLNSPLLSLRIAMDLAESYRLADRTVEANAAFADAHARLVALGREDTERAGTLLNNWGLVLGNLGRAKDAEQMLRRSIDISRAAGSDAHIEPISWANLARALFDLGRYADGIPLAERAQREAVAQKDQIVADQALLVAARLHIANGSVDRGEAMLDEVASHFAKMFPPTHNAFMAVDVDRIRVAEMRGRLDDAARMADAALNRAAPGTPLAAYRPLVLRRRAEINVKRGDYAAAREDIELALPLMRADMPDAGPSGVMGSAYLTLAQALIGEGKREAARTALEEAVRHLDGGVGPEHHRARLARELLAKQLVARR